MVANNSNGVTVFNYQNGHHLYIYIYLKDKLQDFIH